MRLMNTRIGMNLLIVLLGLLFTVFLLVLLRPPEPSVASSTGGNCSISVNNSVVTDFTSADASALQNAVDAAANGDLLKVSGVCAGIQARLGVTQTLYLSKSLSLRGGYDANDWSLPPDPDLYETFLDAMSGGRVVYLTGSITVTLEGLRLINGLTVNGEDGAGIFHGGEAVTPTVRLVNMLLSNNTSDSDGGALYLADHAIVTIIDSRIRDNSALNNGDGGGIDFENHISATIRDSGFVRNSSTGEGGGIYLAGNTTVRIANSTVVSNTSGNAGGGLFAGGQGTDIVTLASSAIINNQAMTDGGGIHIDSSPSVTGTTYLTVTSSLISGNTASDEGGGLSNDWGNQVTLVNSTLSGNVAAFGGAIATKDALRMSFSTVAYNTALSGTAGIEVLTATSGIKNYTGTLTLANSIIANHTGANCSYAVPNTAADEGYNLEDANDCKLSASSSLAKVDPQLGPLTDHGGPALPGGFVLATHALPPASPAMDLIPGGVNACGAAIVNDQRGAPRPIGTGCDAGAFELGHFALLPIVIK